MNRKHKGIWREAGKLGMCVFIVLPKKMKAVFPPADKDGALIRILHLSYTQCDKQNKDHTCQLVPYSEV